MQGVGRVPFEGLGWFSTVSVLRGVFSASQWLFTGFVTTLTRGRPGNESRGQPRLADPRTPPPASTLGEGAARAALTRKSLLTPARPQAKSANLQCGTTLVSGEFGALLFKVPDCGILWKQLPEMRRGGRNTGREGQQGKVGLLTFISCRSNSTFWSNKNPFFSLASP